MFMYLIKCMHARKVSCGKQVYVADGKNEIIKFAILNVTANNHLNDSQNVFPNAIFDTILATHLQQ